MPTLERVTRYAIDAPTVVYLVDEGVSVHPDHRLVAPGSIRLNALGLLLAQVRAGRRAEGDALRCHEKITAMKMRLLSDRVSRRAAWRIAVEHGWDCLEDGECLAIATLQADALVTVDQDLAARAKGLVRLASVRDLEVPG